MVTLLLSALGNFLLGAALLVAGIYFGGKILIKAIRLLMICWHCR